MNTRKPYDKSVKGSSTYKLKTTPENDEGPYYLSNSPERSILFGEDTPGEKLTLSGYVFDINKRPVVHAWLDFWQANGRGVYDISGFTLRGHQYTDRSGKYVLTTVIPGGYANRTPHIHVKVQANDGSPILTTQLFMAGLVSNKKDFLYKDDLTIDIKDGSDGKEASFDFVVKV